MAKAIIKSTPMPTHGTALVVIADENSGVEVFDELNFSNHTGVELNENDTVEITITSPGNCDVIKKFTAAQGGVTQPPNEIGGRAMLTILPEPDEFPGVKLNDSIWFAFTIPIPNPLPALKRNDVIEMILTSNASAVYVKTLKEA